MGTEIETQLREQLAARAAAVSPRAEWQRGLVSELGHPEHPPGRRYPAIAAAAAVLALVLGTWWLGRGEDQVISPAPPVPSVGSNAELIDLLPEGQPAQVLYYDDEGRVMTPEGFFTGSDGAPFRLGRTSQLVGRSGDGLVVFEERAGYVVVRPDGTQRPATGPNPGLYAVAPEGRRVYTDGAVSPIGSTAVIGSLGVPTHIDGPYSAYWGGAGIVFTDGGTGRLQLVPRNGGAARPVSGYASRDATVHPTRGSDRVLVRDPDHCSFVGRLRATGDIEPFGDPCRTDLLSLSPNGTTALLGTPNASPAPPGVGSVTGLLDLASGQVTQLPWLAALDQYTADDSFGDDLFALTWENGDTVLLAYYTDRSTEDHLAATVRLVRCSTGSEPCEAVAGEVHPRLIDAQMFSQGIGEAGVY